MRRGYICFILLPKERDPEFVLRIATHVKAAAFLRYGYRPIFADMDHERFVQRIERYGRDRNVVAFVSGGGWALDDEPFARAGKPNLFAEFGKPFIASVADQPFASWVRPKIEQEFPNKVVTYNDPHSLRHVAETIPLSGQHFYAPPSVIDYRYNYELARRPARQRHLSLLFVGTTFDADGIRRRFRKRFPERAALFDQFFEAGVSNYHESVVDIGKRVFAEQGEEPDFSRTGINLLFEMVDWSIRNERRCRLLASLAKYPMTIITRFPKNLPGLHPDTTVLPSTPFPKVLELTQQARTMAIAQPTYSDGLTERTVFAMHRGAVVLTTPNNAIEKLFLNGRDLLTIAPDFSDIDNLMDRLRDDQYVDEMAEAGREAVRDRFAPEAAVRRILERID